MVKPRCKTCNKVLKRITQDVLATEPYKGNQVCYLKKERIVKGWSSQKFKEGDTEYSYRLWDGESYRYFYGKKFCGRNCAAMYAVRRLS